MHLCLRLTDLGYNDQCVVVESVPDYWRVLNGTSSFCLLATYQQYPTPPSCKSPDTDCKVPAARSSCSVWPHFTRKQSWRMSRASSDIHNDTQRNLPDGLTIAKEILEASSNVQITTNTECWAFSQWLHSDWRLFDGADTEYTIWGPASKKLAACLPPHVLWLTILRDFLTPSSLGRGCIPWEPLFKSSNVHGCLRNTHL